MTNFNIIKTDNDTFVVKADSERFGTQAIVFESWDIKKCISYITRNGGTAKEKTMQCRGFRITRHIDGTYTVNCKDNRETYTSKCNSFSEAGSWVWNMANNHDVGSVVNQKMCQVFCGDFIRCG